MTLTASPVDSQACLVQVQEWLGLHEQCLAFGNVESYDTQLERAHAKLVQLQKQLSTANVVSEDFSLSIAQLNEAREAYDDLKKNPEAVASQRRLQNEAAAKADDKALEWLTTVVHTLRPDTRKMWLNEMQRNQRILCESRSPTGFNRPLGADSSLVPLSSPVSTPENQSVQSGGKRKRSPMAVDKQTGSNVKDPVPLAHNGSKVNTITEIEFDEVYQNGNARYKHHIIREIGIFYILRCDACPCHFKDKPALGACKHLRNPARHEINFKVTFKLAIQMCGIRVLNCDEQRQKLNNDRFHRALTEEGYQVVRPARMPRIPSSALDTTVAPIDVEPGASEQPVAREAGMMTFRGEGAKGSAQWNRDRAPDVGEPNEKSSSLPLPCSSGHEVTPSPAKAESVSSDSDISDIESIPDTIVESWLPTASKLGMTTRSQRPSLPTDTQRVWTSQD